MTKSAMYSLYLREINNRHMKNKVLSVLVLMVCMVSAKAQLLNADFETWAQKTNYLDLTLTTPNVLDTARSNSPDNWTTSNDVTAGTVFHNKVLVTQDGAHQSGAYSVKLMSDSVSAQLNGVPVLGTLTLNFVCPGFAVNGNFPINLSAFANLSGNFNPALLSGAGVPVAGRLAKIGGYIKYSPVGGDTAYIVAVLRRGGTVVAEAKYLHAASDASFQHFEAPFVYYNCLEPDTLVYTLASGNPYGISGVVLGGSTGLHIGSSLNVDSLYTVDTAVGFVLPPLVLDDSASALAGHPVGIKVSVNDQNCYGGTQTITVTTQPMHGTAVVSGDSIIYTATSGYSGMDTFYYTASVNGSAPSNPGRGTVRVSPNTAVVDIAAVNHTVVYPNPASSRLHISTSNSDISTVTIYDMLGNVVKTDAMTNNMSVDVSSFTEGIYILRFSGSEGKVISSARFTVVK